MAKDSIYWELEPYIFRKTDGTLTGMIVDYYQNLKSLASMCSYEEGYSSELVNNLARFSSHKNKSLVSDKLRDSETLDTFFGPVLEEWWSVANDSRYGGAYSGEFVSDTISLISTKHRFNFITLMGQAISMLAPFLAMVVLVALIVSVLFWVIVCIKEDFLFYNNND